MRASDQLPLLYNAAQWFVGRQVQEGRRNRVALLTDDATLTYAQLDESVRRFAGALKRAGVHRGDRVALIQFDTPMLSIAFWGAIASGAVAVPINTLLKPADHQRILEDSEARLVVADPAIVPDASALAEPGTVCWTPDEARQKMADGDPVEEYAKTHRDSFAFFLYTSGTTGEPKGVVHLQHDMFVCCETYGKAVLQIRESDRVFSMAKLFFAYGLGNSQYFPFHVGASTVLFPGRPAPEAIFEQVRKHRPTLFFGAPTGYATMLAAMEGGAKADFSSVRACASAGESLPGPLLERWKAKTGMEILDGIGSTELCHIFLSNFPGKVRPGSTGVPVPGYDLRLVDETGSDVPRGELGDLLVRGDSAMALYWNKHEITKSTLRGEWIRTGDKYSQDADGYFFHGGRSDDMLRVSGQWVSPVEVEAALIAHPSVLECAVVGEEDADGLTRPHAYVTLKPGADAAGLEAALLSFVRERVSGYKCPRWISVIPELPKTATGKIQRFLLRARRG